MMGQTLHTMPKEQEKATKVDRSDHSGRGKEQAHIEKKNIGDSSPKERPTKPKH